MRFFAFIFSLLFAGSMVAASGNWVAGSKLKSTAPQDGPSSKKEVCEQIHGEECFDRSGLDPRKFKVGEVDDLNRVKYAKENISECSDQLSCQSALTAMDCSQLKSGAYGVISEGYVEVYCAVPIGYHKKHGLVPDPEGTAASDAEDAVMMLKATESLSIEAIKKRMDCGKSVIAAFMIRNHVKSLSKLQKKSIRQKFKDLREFLVDGDLESAKNEMEELVPDAVLVTAEDKVAMLNKINECL